MTVLTMYCHGDNDNCITKTTSFMDGGSVGSRMVIYIDRHNTKMLN